MLGGTRSPVLPGCIPGGCGAGLHPCPYVGWKDWGRKGSDGLSEKGFIMFPSFYGVVLFMAGEGNEQLARQAKANTAAAERPLGLAGALLGGAGAGGGGTTTTGGLLPFRDARRPERVPWCSRRAKHPSGSPQRGNPSAMETGHT